MTKQGDLDQLTKGMEITALRDDSMVQNEKAGLLDPKDADSKGSKKRPRRKSVVAKIEILS